VLVHATISSVSGTKPSSRLQLKHCELVKNTVAPHSHRKTFMFAAIASAMPSQKAAKYRAD